MPEHAAGSHTFNPVFGATHNPHDLGRTAGGSTGGGAAALASGAAWLATGSDLGGSLRNPAAFCSVVGLRPSPGRCPQSDAAPTAWRGRCPTTTLPAASFSSPRLLFAVCTSHAPRTLAAACCFGETRLCRCRWGLGLHAVHGPMGRTVEAAPRLRDSPRFLEIARDAPRRAAALSSSL